jgi:hypothetical protein
LDLSPRSGVIPGSPPFLFNPPGNIIPLEDFPCTRLYSPENKDIDPTIFAVWNMDLKSEYSSTGNLKAGYVGSDMEQLRPIEGLQNPFNTTSHPPNRTFAGNLLDISDDASPSRIKNDIQNNDSDMHSQTLDRHFEFKTPSLENPFDRINSQYTSSPNNQNPLPLTPVSLLIPAPLSLNSISPASSHSAPSPYSPLHNLFIHDKTSPPYDSKDSIKNNLLSPYNSSEDLNSFLNTYGNTYNTYNKLEIPYINYNSGNISNNVFSAHFNDDDCNNKESLYESRNENKFVNENIIASHEEKGDDDDDDEEIPSLQHMYNPSIEIDVTDPPKTADRPQNTGIYMYLCVFVCV